MTNSTALIVLALATLLRPALASLIEGLPRQRVSPAKMVTSGIYTLFGVICLCLGMALAYGPGGSVVAGILIILVPAIAMARHDGPEEEEEMYLYEDGLIFGYIILWIAIFNILIGVIGLLHGGWL